MNINAPAIMFPYIRAFISNLTSNLGNIIQTITLPPYFFGKEIEILNIKEYKDKINIKTLI
jgi:preprotein translocase subunit SecB